MASSPNSGTSTPSTKPTTPTTSEAAIPARAGALLEIDLGAIVANWRQLADRTRPADCAAVVKADAYGLGAGPVAAALRAAGCRQFFVAQLDEALALAPNVPAGSTGVLNGLMPGSEGDFLASGAVPVLNSLDEIGRWQGQASARGRRLKAFVHLDTGMNRLGLGPGEQDVLAAEPGRLEGLEIAGWISHLACADEAEHPMNREQLGRFRSILARLPAAPASLANSSGIFLGTDFHFDIPRPGCALYGVNPTPDAPNPMRPVVRLAARILQVRDVDRPMTVGYGAAHSVARRGRVATIAIGYADGYSRDLSAVGHVLAGGRPSPIIGRVSMDLITLDVSDVPEDAVRPGCLVEVIGPHRPVDTVAREAGTIGYEILTSLGRRYWRHYIQPGDTPSDTGPGETGRSDSWAS